MTNNIERAIELQAAQQRLNKEIAECLDGVDMEDLKPEVIHAICTEVCRGQSVYIASRVELLTVMSVYQLRAVVQRRRYTGRLHWYVHNMMHWRVSSLSKHKRNVAFLYVNNAQFRGLVDRSIALVQEAAADPANIDHRPPTTPPSDDRQMSLDF